MESLKPLLLLVVLGGVGYGVYVALNQAPPPEPSPRVAPNWNKSPQTGAKTARKSGPATPAKPVSAPYAPATSSSPLSAGSSLPFGIGRSTAQSAAAPAPIHSEAPPPQVAATAPLENPPPLAASAPANNPPPLATRAPVDNPPPLATVGTITPPPRDDAAIEAERARGEFASSMRYAQSLLSGGKLVEALRELSKWYDHPALSPADQNQLVETLGQLAGTVIYSPDPWINAPYVVQQGDTLETIADGCQVPWQLLAKINGIQRPAQLNPGQQLKVIRGPFHAQLNLSQQWLALFVDGMYAGRFPVQGGPETLKPDGTYPVAKITADNPANAARRPYVSLGGDLHLCVPEDAGAAGVAAVRINPRDMADVFDMLSERSQVTVRR